MKTLLVTFIIGILGISSMFANVRIPPTDVLKIFFIFEIGKKPSCIEWSICDVGVFFSSWGALGGGLMGGLLVDKNKGFFELDFSRDDLIKYQPEKLALIDGRTSITFDEPYVFPKEIQKALGAEKDLLIPKGDYPVVIRDNIYTIKFPY